MTKTTEGQVIKGHCPQCGAGRNCEIVKYLAIHDEDEYAPVWLHSEYSLLKCRGCDEIFFKKEVTFSEDMDHDHNPITGEVEVIFPSKITYWPSPSKRDRPKWISEIIIIDRDLGSLFENIYTALDNDLEVLAAIGIRTTFDRSSELLGVDPSLSFAKKLEELNNAGQIGVTEKDVLEILTDAGSAAAHRGWKPDLKELETMMSIIESFLHRSFVLSKAASALKAKVPKKPKKKSPAKKAATRVKGAKSLKKP